MVLFDQKFNFHEWMLPVEFIVELNAWNAHAIMFDVYKPIY